MKEFMLLIKKQITDEEVVSEEFLKACENYIQALKSDGRLISAQPIEEKGNMILSKVSATSKNSDWKISPIKETKEVIGGYYHLLAKDLDDVIIIAKANPEFVYHPQSRIEIRPLKSKEESTGYLYPNEVVEYLSFMDQIEVPF